MLDSKAEVKEELHRIICKGTKKDFISYVSELKEYLSESNKIKRFEESSEYILNNWSASKYRLKKMEGKVGSSTEGHVSHVLSSRMSTNALGWSLKGADKMAQLRAYYLNGGNMLELVRYQKEELSLAAGGEYQTYIDKEKIAKRKDVSNTELYRFHDRIQAHLAVDVKKKVYFQEHIWIDI